jgi:hypothetical protein
LPQRLLDNEVLLEAVALGEAIELLLGSSRDRGGDL